jgi:hypothetical protein
MTPFAIRWSSATKAASLSSSCLIWKTNLLIRVAGVDSFDSRNDVHPKAQRIRVSGQIAEPQVGIAVTSARGMISDLSRSLGIISDLIRFLGMTSDLSRFLAPTPLSDTDPAKADFQRASTGIQSP